MTISHVKWATLVGVAVYAVMPWAYAAPHAAPQAVTQPTPMQRAQQRSRAQDLQQKKQTRRLQRDQARRTQDTARRPYKNQPALQKRMKRASDVRQKQSRDADRDLDRRLRKARRPQPVQSAPSPASSSS